MRELPGGTVTFLFTDVEGSTRLLHELGPEAYAEALAEHRRVIREAFARHGGVEVDTQGDAFFVAFPTAPGAIAAAREARTALAIPVRMGLHTGTPFLAEEGYVGADVNRAARIAACGHGGQMLVSAATASLVGSDGLRDLGEHRLKDLSAPERIYQLGDGQFPRLKSLHQTNLPVPATPFLGRERELTEIGELLARDEVRLVTLTGPGGTGKTRLGLQAAAEASDRYPDGIFWVPLAALRDPAFVAEEVGRAVGATDDLATHVADKRLLLLLDNFEHLVEAAPGLGELLLSCPNLELLVTSRELLTLAGEQAYPVPPLESAEAVRFFCARARSVKPDFAPDQALGELCARLDQLPLALELAAARVRVLSPPQLLERLGSRLDLLKAGRGADPRQQTLRATIEWSYELLDAEEQRLFARLAVFRGGCTLDAAEMVCDADIDIVQSLVDKSLLRVRDDERFWMLESIREFAVEQLEHSGEAKGLRRQHADHFLALAEEAYPQLASDPKGWLLRLEAEHDNLRAAMDDFEAAGETQLVLQMSGALARFWYMRGHIIEPRRRLETALTRDDRPTPARARALRGLAMITNAAGDFVASRAQATAALDLYDRFGDSAGAAHARYLQGNAAAGERDFETAQTVFEESLRRFREVGDSHYSLLALRALAWASGELGDEQRFRSLYEQLLPLARAAGNKRLEARALAVHAGFARDEARVADALAKGAEALRIDVAIGEFSAIIQSLSNIAATLAVAGRAAEAVQLIAAVRSWHEEKGAIVPGWVADGHEESLTQLRQALDAVSFERAWQAGSTLTVEDAVALALQETSGPA